jgi:hypothetical protein
MNNCDVFILISILIVVLLLIYNRNKRDKQIEAFITDDQKTQLANNRFAIWRKDFGGIDIPGLSSGNAQNSLIQGKTSSGVYYQNAIEEWIKNIAIRGLSDIWPLQWTGDDTRTPHEKRIKQIATDVVADSPSSTGVQGPRGPRGDQGPPGADGPPGPSGGGSGGSGDTRSDAEIKKVIEDALHKDRGGGQANIDDGRGELKRNVEILAENAARAQFDKLKTLEGAIIQLNTSSIKCMKDGSVIDCPDSIQPSGGSSSSSPPLYGLGTPPVPTYTKKDKVKCLPEWSSGEIGSSFMGSDTSAKTKCTNNPECVGFQKYKSVWGPTKYQLKNRIDKTTSSNLYTCWTKN